MASGRLKSWNGNNSFIPCSITLCNALCGLTALLYATGHQPETSLFPMVSIWLILAAMCFDMFDGYAARKLNATSLHGMQLDSLSDMLSFGVAPAILIWVAGQSWWDASFPGNLITWAAAGFYTVCTLWRLAQYNTLALTTASAKEGFTGLPSPAGALAICSVLLLLNRIDPGPKAVALVVVAYAFAIGFLMVSEFEYSHIKKLVCTGPTSLRTLLLVLVIAALVQFGSMAFFALVHLYIFSGPIAGLLIKNDEVADSVS